MLYKKWNINTIIRILAMYFINFFNLIKLDAEEMNGNSITF